MNLRQFSWITTYPLRTILVYDLAILDVDLDDNRVEFLITDHEEMWSFGDMIEALPLVGWAYNLFRRSFAFGFLGASALSYGVLSFLKRPVAVETRLRNKDFEEY
eukprot:TRINITY_DN7855_c0_g1_i2.p1 TRINITY_DN7855_c0_g1~~TRINITY_DN7855_c0_g1_i2.p1  ORF type:complete len:105 (-),score=24.41 TRINITY_DN7855_c0_g1_i2:86-400(-)